MSELLDPVLDIKETVHPIDILRREHDLILEMAAGLKAAAGELISAPDTRGAERAMDRIRRLAQDFRASESHYLREENVLFPYLEKHGIVGPPAVMWREHDQIRAAKKLLFAIAGEPAPSKSAAEELARVAEILAASLDSHFRKENQMLFAMAMEVVTPQEWDSAMKQFGEIGFWRVVPAAADPGPDEERSAAAIATDGEVAFETGSMPVSVLEALLDTLPVDITFVDAQDRVRYFSNTPDRVFPRTTAIIGREVQQCHPEKSIHVVNQILDDFRNNRKSNADFWIEMGGRFLLIRYFAVRKNGEYLGCLEVTQDATWVRGLEGEKRLL